MRLAREDDTAARKSSALQRPHATPAPAGTAVQRVPDLQSSVGNQVVVAMLRQTGQPGAQERHRHGPECGHPAQEAQAQRSPGDAAVARAAEDGHLHHDHEGVWDTTPEGQRALLASAMNSSSAPLPSSVVAKAGAFYQNEALSSTRVHSGAVAQRATAAMGAQAMTVGNHIFLSAGAASDEKLIGHELSHVDKNLKGLPETGHSNGAGVTVTDPRQGSERAAEKDGAAYAAGARTAPSVTAPRGAANGLHEPVQRMMESGEQPESAPAGRRVAPEDPASALSTEDYIGSLPEDSEQEVVLKRGVTPTQRKHLQNEIIRGSFISLPKMVKAPDENATRPDPEHVAGYVKQTRDEETAKLIEFSTDPAIAAQFASEARYGYVLTIRIKRKYLVKGATGAENGWIAKQSAPYDIVGIEQRDSTVQQGLVPLTESEFRDVVRNEETAEFLLSVQEPVAMAAHLQKFPIGPQRTAEAMRIMKLRKATFQN
ncbi:MAG TPA: DUF4157 domain-containing protein [Streptomyces sp.]|uniref:eCIS core domain-containing protein n=1 Tax=Streptomyces sp. TaxID=1931 RepID=UPI002BBA83D4|nr:DUF4157 domain-containing protein [Streptomyces sp.]HWU10678.1 DUF4157 domain-containing protein [Streptomyces sp.]